MPTRVLNVAEKPSVAREAARALSGGQASSRRVHDSTVWDFRYRGPGGGEMDMAFGAVAGHLMEIDFQEPFNRWSACDPEALYSKPTELDNGARNSRKNARGGGRAAGGARRGRPSSAGPSLPSPTPPRTRGGAHRRAS